MGLTLGRPTNAASSATQGAKSRWHHTCHLILHRRRCCHGCTNDAQEPVMSVVSITPQLRTTDLERSIRFYTEKVGLQLDFVHADFYAGIRAPGGGFHLKLVDAADPSVQFVRMQATCTCIWA